MQGIIEKRTVEVGAGQPGERHTRLRRPGQVLSRYDLLEGAWEMDLDSGVTVRLGRREVDERIDRFIHTASQVIAHRLNEINYIDMRYSNGFAIGWRNPSAPASAPSKRADDADV